MADRSVVVRLRAEVGQYVASMNKAKVSAQQFGREMTGQGKTARADLDTIGRGALVMASGMAVGFGLAAKAAMDWESAWAGVTKTVDGSASEMADLEGGLRDLAKELPATHAEIAGVAEAAGALGIQRSAIEGFTRTMIDLGETTNVTADQAATSFAQIGNIMGTAQTDFDRMGSTLVDLGNNGASTEAEILELANRLAAAGNIAGLTESDIFAFASTLASVGVEAEAGGTAMSKVFTTVSDAVLDGSEKLDTFARVAGVTSKQFAASFRDDPAAAIETFVAGLGRMIAAGESTTGVFQELELTDSRLMNALRSTAGAGDLLTESINLGREAWEANNALQTEAEKRYETTAAKMEIARNNIVDLGVNIGGVLLPALAGAAEGASTMAQGFSEMPGPLKVASAGIGGATTAGLGMAAAATILVPKIKAARDALIAMGAAGKVAAGAMPWLAVAAAAIGAVSYAFGQNAQNAEEAEERVKGYADAIKEAGSRTGGAEQRLRDLAAEFPSVAKDIEDSGMSLEEWAAALSGSGAAFEAFIGKLEARGPDAFSEANGGLENLIATLRTRTRPELLQAAEDAQRFERVVGDAGDGASNAAPNVETLAGSLGMSADEAKRAKDEFQDLIDAYRASVDPLFGMLDALQANRDAQKAEAEARAEGARAIADASEDVADAEEDLRDARKGDDPDAVAAAEERLADARERLGEVQADAAISAEDLARFNQDAAESALDAEVAARELAGAIADGTVNLEDAKGMLQEWADQGLITQGQADSLKTKFDEAAYSAGLLDGDFTATFYANTEEAKAKVDDLAASVHTLGDFLGALFTGNGTVTPVEGSTNPADILGAVLGIPKAAAGGVHAGLTWVGEEGPELVNLGSPSRVFPHGESMQMASAFGLAGPGGSTSIDRGIHLYGNITNHYPSPETPSNTVLRVSRKAAALAGG